ncbi:hypothetical protein FRC00_004880 [Tulasnella sp. 408]|nr:hypothetical protein FRC00_004880 [Tulasnella sp. 408]
MALKILVGGYTSIITALLYTPNGSGTAGSLSLLSQSNAGTNPSWLALNPSNSSILYANQETWGGQIWSFVIDPTTAALTKKSSGSTGGNNPAHFAVLFGGGSEIVAANYDGASTTDMVLGTDRTTFSSSTGPMITYTGSGPNTSRQTVPHPHQVIEYIIDQELLINDLSLTNSVWEIRAPTRHGDSRDLRAEPGRTQAPSNTQLVADRGMGSFSFSTQDSSVDL